MNRFDVVALDTLIHQAKTMRCGNDDYPVLSMTMHDGLVFQNEKFKKIIASKDRTNYKIVKRNQLVISFPIDEGVLAAQRIVDAGIVSPAYGIWDIDQGKVLPEFLEYALRCDRALSYYKAKLRGSTARRRSLPIPTLLEYTVPLPNISEQEHILNVMHKVKSIISGCAEEITLLDNLVKARFVEMFGDPVANGKGWETALCKTLMSKIGSGATPKGGKESYCDEGISLIRSMNVYNNRFEYKDLARITDDQAEQLKNVTIEKKDVLLNITGASVARCCVVPDDLLPARVNQHVSVIRCKERILPEFICCMFTEDNFQRLLWNTATAGGATREAITKQQIEGLILIVPPIDLQRQYVTFVKLIDKLKFQVVKIRYRKDIM